MQPGFFSTQQPFCTHILTMVSVSGKITHQALALLSAGAASPGGDQNVILQIIWKCLPTQVFLFLSLLMSTKYSLLQKHFLP